jgi:hypothetical protein
MMMPVFGCARRVQVLAMLTTAMRPRPWITLLAITGVLLHTIIAARHTGAAFVGRPQIDALALDPASICRGGRTDPFHGSNQPLAPKPADRQGICDLCCPVPVFVLGPATIVLAVLTASRKGEVPLVVSVPTPWTMVWPPPRGPPAVA